MLWKTFGGTCIYQSATAEVFDNYVFRWLRFGNNTIQSLIYKINPAKFGLFYVDAMISAPKLRPGNCCLLGLGGAGAAHALAPFLGSHAVTAVESSEEVIDLAQRFFMLERLTNLKIVHADAQHYITDCQQKFDHILIDLFGDQSFPAHCFNQKFFASCKTQLQSSGLLTVNIASMKEQEPIFRWLVEIFDQATLVIPVKKCANIIVIAGEEAEISGLIEDFKRHDLLRKIFWDRHWGIVAELW